MLWVLGDRLAVQAAGGTGSKASVVAPEVSCVSVKFELAIMALAKLSFGGGGAVMGKLDGLEYPPPGGGVKTVTFPLPTVAISLAAMATVIWVGEHADGVGETPRKNTIEPTPCVGSIVFLDRKSTRLNSSHLVISYAVFCLKKKKKKNI